MIRKDHMQIFKKNKKLRIAWVNYCAFGGHYLKDTHLFHNMGGFKPCGSTGDGRCAKQGSNSKQPCSMGSVINGRFKHFFTIGRESHKEFKSATVSRKKGKNEIPELLTCEMINAAVEEWKSKMGTRKSKVPKR